MKTNDQIRRENLEIAIKRLKTAKALAEKAETSPAYISQVKNAQPDSKTGIPKHMGDELARKIEEALGEGKGWIDTDHSSKIDDPAINAPKGTMFKGVPTKLGRSINEPLETNVSGPMMLRVGRAVAVVGEVQGGPDGYISIDEYASGGVGGWVQVYTTDASAYGLLVRGDSMRPRIKSGEHIVVEPGIEALPGDDVVVRFADGTAVVKELLWIRDGEVCLGSISDGIAPITRPIVTVVSMHRVAAIIPRGSGMYHAEA